MITERIQAMLQACEAGQPPFPPTVLFNETWLLRVVLDWFARHGGDRYPFSPLPGASWFSEAWLPSAFLPRYRGDRLAETRTHADGVIGHFAIGDQQRAGLGLLPEARQFVVLEAKLGNRLSAGVKNAPYFDQAARSVACVAEVLRRADRDPAEMDVLAFYVVAPQARIDDGVFAWETTADALRRKVRHRVEDYAGERDAWFRNWFQPTLERIDVRSLAWEEIVEAIAFHDPTSGQLIDSFYGHCLKFNRPRERAAFPGRSAGLSRVGPPAIREPEPTRPTPSKSEETHDGDRHSDRAARDQHAPGASASDHR